ncbi:glutathione peroxidase [Nocardioides cavernaquae]|uniref:Glutathione peroxidase n=1 Tax=Nocardioides cavernaquae TaxID=2321396 RepID=A0A3A5HC93_9ACTN|nr:glutathione peroxidase [Nocardioides cavernaquae]RJS45607.1 glutathione peroxidase [Nocardioides cavernaquae]
MTTLSDFTATTLDGREQPLAAYSGQVALVVNTASQCAFTGQYAGLQDLHATYADRGFTVLGFPCNQFGNQEPGDAEAIGAVCQRNYGVEFPMFSKVDVKGRDAHPLFRWLTRERPGRLGRTIRWNFTKFLVDAEGRVIKRYGSTTKPEQIARDVEAALAR